MEGHHYVDAGPTSAGILEILDDQQIGCFHDLGTAAAPVTGLPSESEAGAIMAASQRHGIKSWRGRQQRGTAIPSGEQADRHRYAYVATLILGLIYRRASSAHRLGHPTKTSVVAKPAGAPCENTRLRHFRVAEGKVLAQRSASTFS